jgi:hypothetical protein
LHVRSLPKRTTEQSSTNDSIRSYNIDEEENRVISVANQLSLNIKTLHCCIKRKMTPSCSCKKGKCINCFMCTRCGCFCPKSTKKRSRRSTDTMHSYAEDEDEDESFMIPVANKLSMGTEIIEKVISSIQTLPDIHKALNIDSNVGRGMPIESSRMESSDIKSFDSESRSRMIHFTTEAMKAICNIILPKAGKDLLNECCKRIHKNYSITDDKKLQDNIKVVIDKLPKRSNQRKAIIAPLAKSFTNEYLYDTFGLGGKTVATHRKLFSCLAKGNLIESVLVSRVKYDPLIVKRAVRFILSDNNIQRISWGTKKVEIDGAEIDFPKLIRKKVKQQIKRDYMEYYPAQAD